MAQVLANPVMREMIVQMLMMAAGGAHLPLKLLVGVDRVVVGGRQRVGGLDAATRVGFFLLRGFILADMRADDGDEAGFPGGYIGAEDLSTPWRRMRGADACAPSKRAWRARLC